MASDSQRELILEQRHLLGVFFAVVLLGGLSFAAGFIMGRTRGEEEAAARYTSVNAAIPREQAEEKKPDGKPNASDLTFFDTVDQKKPADIPPPPPAKPKPATTKTTTASTPVTASVTVHWQVGAFAEQAQASALVKRLGTLGFTARAVTSSSDKLYRVRVGPYSTEALALAAKSRLEANGFTPLRR